MIQHLQGRQNALEPLGWTGRKAEWIAMAYLDGEGHQRAQLAFYLQMNRLQTLRFVQTLVAKGFAAADKLEDQKVCRIFNRRIYRALGAEGIRHRRVASSEILFRRLLSLDYVIEHPGCRPRRSRSGPSRLSASTSDSCPCGSIGERWGRPGTTSR